MRKIIIYFMIFVTCLLAADKAYANNIAVSNVSITGQNTSSQTCEIQFDISWENSWKNGINYDAAWIFIKYSTDAGATWSHATLKSTTTNPLNDGLGWSKGSNSDLSVLVPVHDPAQSGDKKGAFLQRTANGTGTLSSTSVQFVWDWGSDKLSSDGVTAITASTSARIKVFSIEMVYIPTGNFYVGDGTNRTAASNSHFFDAADAADPRDPVLITSTQPYISNVSNGTGTAGDIAWVNESTSAGNLPVSRTQFNANYPTGYNAYYIMKYEISQNQYADFLNTLTSTQASTRYPNQNGNYRHTISGTYPNYSASRPDRACNYLSWMDGCAYADWAGLRPWTELEFEKACRGGQTVVNNEYAWGSTSITAAVAISGSENGTETITTVNANCCYNSQTFTGGDAGQGPLRCGIFATSSSTRQTSGAGYYGVMELSGNLSERPVSVMDSQAGQTLSTFTGVHGDGSLSANGNADTANWPGLSGGEVTGAGGGGFRGGDWVSGESYARSSGRDYAASTVTTRASSGGGRCARTAP